MLYVAIPFFLICLIILIIALKKHRHKKYVLWGCISVFSMGLSFLLYMIFEFILGLKTLPFILLILFFFSLMMTVTLFLIALLKSRPEEERVKHCFKLVIGGCISETLGIIVGVFGVLDPFNIGFGKEMPLISGAILFALGILAQSSVILPRYKDNGGP